MLITSKGRYALRLMIYIAAFGGDGAEGAGTASNGARSKISLREVSERERISLKYLEQLVRPLMAAGLLKSVRGKRGGYVLGKPASEIRAGDIQVDAMQDFLLVRGGGEILHAEQRVC